MDSQNNNGYFQFFFKGKSVFIFVCLRLFHFYLLSYSLPEELEINSKRVELAKIRCPHNQTAMLLQQAK